MYIKMRTLNNLKYKLDESRRITELANTKLIEFVKSLKIHAHYLNTVKKA